MLFVMYRLRMRVYGKVYACHAFGHRCVFGAASLRIYFLPISSPCVHIASFLFVFSLYAYLYTRALFSTCCLVATLPPVSA